MTIETKPPGGQPESVIVRTVLALYREMERLARDEVMTLAQYRLLVFLLRGPRRTAELAVAALVRKPSITPIVANLEKQGWVTRNADPKDQRAANIRITEAGRKAMAEFEKHLENELVALLGRDVVTQANAGLAPLHRAHTEAREASFLRWAAHRLGKPELAHSGKKDIDT